VTLIIQIALGMFLGYLLIEHRVRLGRWAVLAVKVALAVVALAALITAFAYIFQSAGSAMPDVSARLSRVGEKLTTLVLALPLLAVILIGAFGLFLFVRKMVRRWFRIEAAIATILIMSFLSALIVWPIDLYLQWNTPYGDIYRSVDAWSRRNGYADLFGGLLSFSLTLWPWPIIFIGNRFGVNFFDERAALPNAPGESEGVEN